ncbi:MAG: hypothetical protein C4326_08355 [Ignavibacteria bacterium]
MRLDQRTVNNLGYISITIMMAMLVLLWFRIVPDSFAVPFFVLALLLFLSRIVLRVTLFRQERKAMRENDVNASRS